MKDLLYKDEVYRLVGLCMEIHRELGKGHDEIIYKDALVIELERAGIPFARERRFEITYKGVLLPHFYYADFVVWHKILFEGKACACLTESHLKQVLNYLAASKLHLGLLVNFGADSLEWKRVVLTRHSGPATFGNSSRPFAPFASTPFFLRMSEIPGAYVRL